MQTIPPTRKAMVEALALTEDILKNMELSELPLHNIALKVSRLARLLNDFQMQKIMDYEIAGYPLEPDGLPPATYELAVIACREYKITENNEIKKYIFGTSINSIENELKSSELRLSVAQDPHISISSANPNQYVHAPQNNTKERDSARLGITNASRQLASRYSFLHRYVSEKNNELKFSGISDDIFTRFRGRVDNSIGKVLPGSIEKFIAIYNNLQSENAEDWSNAVHGCRRVLQDLANQIFPPTNEFRKKEIKLGEENYINRIIAFVEDHADSSRYKHLVGSHLEFIGERLDSIYQAANKGSHEMILGREEADRYVIYTYLIVGDILSLLPEKS